MRAPREMTYPSPNAQRWALVEFGVPSAWYLLALLASTFPSPSFALQPKTHNSQHPQHTHPHTGGFPLHQHPRHLVIMASISATTTVPSPSLLTLPPTLLSIILDCTSCAEIRCPEHRCLAPGIGLCLCGTDPLCTRPGCRPAGQYYQLCGDCYLQTCDRCEEKAGGRCQDCGGELLWKDTDEEWD